MVEVTALNSVIQIATATILAFTALALILNSRQGRNLWAGIGFTLSILCYTVIESDSVQSVLLLRIIVAIGAISIPVFYWLLARAVFDDHFRFHPSLLIWFLALLLLHLNFFVSGVTSWPGFQQVSSVVARLASLGFVLAGVYVAVRTRRTDLIDSRIRFRSIFLFGTAALIGVTLIVELIKIEPDVITVLQVLQRSAILGITLYFLLSNFGIRSGFFFKETSKPKAPAVEDPQLIARLQALMEDEKVYKKEGLTIGQLAELMSEQEYRLRRAINGHLGFRNFNDFLNQYRVNEACEVLSDPTQNRKTILEIAYDLGYQSIGPFNKAFKELKGTTPTSYRKGHAI
jgi:AraC-like DNA-binding protein